jgi:hypothetical protein
LFCGRHANFFLRRGAVSQGGSSVGYQQQQAGMFQRPPGVFQQQDVMLQQQAVTMQQSILMPTAMMVPQRQHLLQGIQQQHQHTMYSH